jgi:hypothetical protein
VRRIRVRKGRWGGLGGGAARVARKAIELAKSSKKNTVFACRGAFAEAVVVPPGISLYGGLDCDKAEWAPRGLEGMDRSAIQGGPGEIVLRLQGDGSGASIAMDGFSVKAAAAVDPGGSSIAAIALDTAVVDLTSMRFYRGRRGSGGRPGEDAPPEVR